MKVLLVAVLVLLRATISCPLCPFPLQACLAELKAAGDDMAAFEEAAQRARGLISESERLGVRMEGLVEQLKEHSRLYCLCKQAYDELRPMVGCDVCQVSSARLAGGRGYYDRLSRSLCQPSSPSPFSLIAIGVSFTPISPALLCLPAFPARLPCLPICPSLWLLQDWYHHECVGLKAPGTEGDGDEPPDSFRCPLCCMRVRGLLLPRTMLCDVPVHTLLRGWNAPVATHRAYSPLPCRSLDLAIAVSHAPFYNCCSLLPSSACCSAAALQMGVKYAHFHKLPHRSLDALKEAALK
jgi:hypothetical protein